MIYFKAQIQMIIMGIKISRLTTICMGFVLEVQGSLETMKLAKIATLITLAVNLFYLGYTVIWISNHGYDAFQDRWLNMLFLR